MIRQIATEEQLADLFTKPLSRYRFQNLLECRISNLIDDFN